MEWKRRQAKSKKGRGQGAAHPKGGWQETQGLDLDGRAERWGGIDKEEKVRSFSGSISF